ncbi:helix-turn-helix domain-containing protein [Rhizosaccharibacter radicis]|uniref:Helix-turn-helix domain-containing protein n=1 Tax=Rhizosaccharibacter radicis TaxID=2782605 RepID=A0ABT1W4I2_9PROT|nr:helix-turn-helix domain-containing protein [Acetobacteraceae bacterium KSS12]
MVRNGTAVDQDVGRQIQICRLFQRFDRTHLAERLQVDPGLIDRWEQGQERIPPAMLIRLAEVLRVRPSQLFALALSDSEEAGFEKGR